MSEFFPTVDNNGFPSMPAATENKANELSIISNVDSSRAIAEVQASLVIAKRFPRDENRAIERIKNSCGRASLANVALYSYARGGTEITGASIRLLEAVKIAWGNIDSGWRELERNEDRAIVQAYAWDKETNVKEERTFEVPLIRYTRKGSYKLSDPRDIYELEANNAARRVRACLQAVIPSDVIEEAINACIATQQANVDMSPETIKALIAAFEKLGVTQSMIEKRLNRKLSAIQAGNVVQLRTVYKSIVDGIGKVSDFFEPEEEAPAPAPSTDEKKPTKKAYTAIKSTIEKYLDGKLNGVSAEDVDNMIKNANITDEQKKELTELLFSVDEEELEAETTEELEEV